MNGGGETRKTTKKVAKGGRRRKVGVWKVSGVAYFEIGSPRRGECTKGNGEV